ETNKNATLTKQLATSDSTIKFLNTFVNNLIAEKEKISAATAAAVREREKLQADYLDLERERDGLINYYRDKALDIDRLAGELANARRQIATLELELKNQTDVAANLSEELTAARAEADRLRSQSDTTEAEYKELQGRVENAETALTATRAKLAEKDQLQEELKNKIEELENKIDTLKLARKERKKAQGKNGSDLKKRLKSLEDINTELSTANTKYEEDLAAINEENSRLRMELNYATGQGGNLVLENHNLKNKLKEQDSLTAKIRKLESNLEQKDLEKQRLETDLKKLNSDYKRSQNLVATMKASQVDLETKNQNYLTELQTQLTKKANEVSNLEAKLRQTEKD
ncbi:404_t:CDS:2, partial [Ambispora leptoticha]